MRMKEYKIYCKDAQTSINIQSHAFYLGYSWAGRQTISYLRQKYIKLDRLGDCEYLSSFNVFNRDSANELTPDEFLRLGRNDVIMGPTE